MGRRGEHCQPTRGGPADERRALKPDRVKHGKQIVSLLLQREDLTGRVREPRAARVEQNDPSEPGQPFVDAHNPRLPP